MSDSFKGEIIVPIDDSFVRDNTTPSTIKFFKESHAKEVHVWVAFSPIRFPFFMRINISTEEELIANKFDSLAEYPGSNSVMYVSKSTEFIFMERYKII